MEVAFKRFVPNMTVAQALESLENGSLEGTPTDSTIPGLAPTSDGSPVKAHSLSPYKEAEAGVPEALAADQPKIPELEFETIESLEWDESLDLNAVADGIGSLSLLRKGSGYMGPQSGIALLKYLQSIGKLLADDESTYEQTAHTSSVDAFLFDATADTAGYRQQCIDWYFGHYHCAYPLLHEGYFRAQVMGALPKPKDGSWPVLYHMVLAIGALTGPDRSKTGDAFYYKKAEDALSMTLFQRGSLHLVQSIALMANYLQKTNRPNTGFSIIGIAQNMALGLGLHREFSSILINPFAMEIRRRVWWTLFIFDAGARLTFGRPASLLSGCSVQLPRNLDDADIAVDDENLVESHDRPCVTSSLIWQTHLAKISNEANTALLNQRQPIERDMAAIDDKILAWYHGLPAYLKQPPAANQVWFDIPRMVLLWRAYHLRIVVSRPFLLSALQSRGQLDIQDVNGMVARCIAASQECLQSIVDFCGARQTFPGALAWYATYWLVTAVFVIVTCLIYDPQHVSALEWRQSVEQVQQVLDKLAPMEPIAAQAQHVLSRMMSKFNVPFPELVNV